MGLMWIDMFCAQEWQKTVSSITINCTDRHCMGSYAGAFAIGY